jgi:hypothetical protein
LNEDSTKTVCKWNERLLWFAGIVVTVGLIAYLFTAGLDRADKLGSVIGAVVGIASLLIAALSRARSGASDQAAPKVTNTVKDATVQGTLFQGGDIDGSITLGGDANDRGDVPPGEWSGH